MYTFDIDPQAMFDDRTHQFEKFGVPLDEIQQVRARVTDMWADAPGGWVYEWSQLAGRYAAAGDHRMASLVYGCAKFPCINTPSRAAALANQLEQFELAAKELPVTFERRIITVPYQGGTVEVATHLYSADGNYPARPVLIGSGGVDTFKMDFDPWWVAFTQHAEVTTLAFDMPGTGESAVAMDRSADEVIRGIADYARTLGDGRVAHFGASFGGNFSSYSGLSATVDAAIDLGGPVDHAFTPQNAGALPFGMRDILGNALHLDAPPTQEQLVASMAPLSRHDLLDQQSNSPMLVINGADDYFVPQADTLVFQGRPHTQVQLVEGSGHCAMSAAGQVIPAMIGWLRMEFAA